MIAEEIKSIISRPWIKMYHICKVAKVDYNRVYQWVNRGCSISDKELAKLAKTLTKHNIK